MRESRSIDNTKVPLSINNFGVIGHMRLSSLGLRDQGGLRKIVLLILLRPTINKKIKKKINIVT